MNLWTYWSPVILTLVTFIPLAGALLLLLFPRRDRDIRVFSLVISLLTFVLSLHLPVHFHRAQAGFQYEIDQAWIPTPNIHYHLGVDGISMWLVVLTTFLTPLCVLISWKSIHERVKEFFILLLVLETALIGVFVALDLFLFYFFWEATLIPMALLIGMYGHGRKVYAAVKFFLYTMIASVFMLAAILWLYAKVGTFDFVTIQNAIRSGTGCRLRQRGAVALPGILHRVRGQGSALPFPHLAAGRARGSAHCRFRAAGRRAAEDGHLRHAALQPGIVSRAGARQRLVGHDSGADRHHLRRAGGAGAAQHEEADCLLVDQPPGLCGAGNFQLYPGRAGWRDLRDAGARRLDRRAVHAGRRFCTSAVIPMRFPNSAGWRLRCRCTPAFFLFIVLASVGLPLLNGFVGEFLVLSGAFQARAVYGILGATGVIWSAGYLLWMYQRVFFGKITHPVNETLPDLDLRERIALVPAAAAALVMGVAPLLWLNAIDPAVQTALAPFAQLASKVVGQ